MENTNDTVLATNQNGETEQNKEQKNVAINVKTSNTEQNKPAWQVKADELKKRIDGTLFVQLAYLSDPKHNCEPVLLSSKQIANIYPIAVNPPVGLIDPKMDWTKSDWVENSTAGLATQLTNLSADVEKIKDYQRDDEKAKQINQQKDTETLKLMSMVTGELGKLSVKVDKLLVTQSAINTQKNDTQVVSSATSTDSTAEKPVETVTGKEGE